MRRVFRSLLVFLVAIYVPAPALSSVNLNALTSNTSFTKAKSVLIYPHKPNVLLIKLKEKYYRHSLEQVAFAKNAIYFRELFNLSGLDDKSRTVLEKTGFDRWYKVEFKSGADEAENIFSLETNPMVEFIEPQFIDGIDSFPNDPYFSQQWSLDNLGQDHGISGADIDALRAWVFSTGGPTSVAVLDTGVDPKHPDLFGNVNMEKGEVFISDSSNGYSAPSEPFDDNGHGTWISGIMGAVGNNAIGISGVTWGNGFEIVPYKVLNREGLGFYSDKAEALIDVVFRKNIKLSCNAWGGERVFSGALRRNFCR